jgi:rhamnulokinase
MLPKSAAASGLTSRPACVAVASHDTASAVAAIPALDEHSVFLSSGTWSLMGVSTDRPNVSPEAYRLGFTNEGSATGGVLLLKNLPGLWILQECRRCWGHAEQAGWDAIAVAAAKTPAFRSLIDPLAPQLQAPQCMPDAMRQFCSDSGQPVPQTLGELARCALESLCLSYRQTVEELRLLTGRTLTAIRVVGGGALNRLLCQMTADACGLEVIAGPVEAAALGNAMVQAIALGHLAGFADGAVALAKSVQIVSYAPAHDDRWQQYSGHIAMFSDRVRSMRPLPVSDSKAVLSR